MITEMREERKELRENNKTLTKKIEEKDNMPGEGKLVVTMNEMKQDMKELCTKSNKLTVNIPEEGKVSYANKLKGKNTLVISSIEDGAKA